MHVRKDTCLLTNTVSAFFSFNQGGGPTDSGGSRDSHFSSSISIHRMPHSFQETTFTSPTYCDHCNGFLWGLTKQGFKCSGCQLVVHANCRQSVSGCKERCTNLAADSVTNTLRQLQLQQRSRFQHPLHNDKKRITPANNTSLWNDIGHFVTSEDMQDIVITSAIHSLDTSQPVSEYLAHLPPLSAQNTTKNFTRFVSRCGPMFNFRDQVILLLNWEKPINTMIAMLIYCLICLHPKLVLLVPHVFLIQIIVTEFNKKYQLSKCEGDNNEQVGNVIDISSTPLKASVCQQKEQQQQQQQQQQRRDPSIDQQQKIYAKSNRFTGSFAASIFPAISTGGGDGSHENSPEYLKNLQNLQNMMGEMSDLHDFIASNSHYVNWSNEAETLVVLQWALGSLLTLSVLIWFVPLQPIFLVGGICVFLLNTRFAKSALRQLTATTAIWKRRRDNTTTASSHFDNMFSTGQDSYIRRLLDRERREEEKAQEVLEISLFENQRWSADMNSFISCMLPYERRGSWTDFSGTIKMASTDKMSTAPKGFRWIDREWSLDKKGPWLDDRLNIELMVYPDDDGWVYTNSNWENEAVLDKGNPPTEKEIIGEYYVTRRRRWMRQCKVVK